MWMWCSSILVIGIVFCSVPRAKASVRCNDTHNPCEELLWNSSQCRDGFCTNPFQGGCLRSLLASDKYEEKYGDEEGGDDSDAPSPSLAALRRRLLAAPRVCNSEDGPAEVERGICVESVNEYPEVRLYSQNWESGFVLSWMMQIIYSELLGVPSTIETGMADKYLNFYDEANRMDYGSSNDFAILKNAHGAGGDCSSFNYNNAEEDGDKDYTGCAHAIMEIWPDGKDLKGVQKSGVIETPLANGISGFQGWHITKSSIDKDPSLAGYFGLIGEENRKKMADTFKRPTTWSDYCNLVSSTNCTVEDGVARRPPAEDGSEDGRFFLGGSYTGHFRFTDENNCTISENCTGHFADYPCGWTSFAKQQAHHLKIALEVDGSEGSDKYSYADLVDIWAAANATKSDVIGLWWTPEATASKYDGSGSDLMQVTFPKTTQECVDNRIDPTKRCDQTATKFDLYGDEKGACGESHISLVKIASVNLELNIRENKSKKAQMSPAHDVYTDFSISQIQVQEILSEWTKRGKDKDNFDLRYVTCKWMADNLEHIAESFIPESHPRIFVASKNLAATVVAYVFSIVAIVLTVGTLGAVLHKKDTIKGAQIEFLMFLLTGLLLVSIGSLLLALEPSQGTCVGSVWLINVGYTLQFGPMCIRVRAIINLVRASIKLKLVKINKQKLLVESFGISALAVLFCIFWTIFDPPHSQQSIQMTNNKNEFGETEVLVSNYCDSESNVWLLVSFIIQAVLFLCGSVLAYQMQSVPKSVDDSTQLAFMIYTSFMTLSVQFIVYTLQGAVGGDIVQKVGSTLFSLDSVANILIFFPRLFFAEAPGNNKESSQQCSEGSAAYYALKISQRVRSSFRSPVPPQHTSIEEANIPEVIFEEEKREEDDDTSPVVRIKCKDRSVDIPIWVLEKYGVEAKKE